MKKTIGILLIQAILFLSCVNPLRLSDESNELTEKSHSSRSMVQPASESLRNIDERTYNMLVHSDEVLSRIKLRYAVLLKHYGEERIMNEFMGYMFPQVESSRGDYSASIAQNFLLTLPDNTVYVIDPEAPNPHAYTIPEPTDPAAPIYTLRDFYFDDLKLEAYVQQAHDVAVGVNGFINGFLEFRNFLKTPEVLDVGRDFFIRTRVAAWPNADAPWKNLAKLNDGPIADLIKDISGFITVLESVGPAFEMAVGLIHMFSGYDPEEAKHQELLGAINELKKFNEQRFNDIEDKLDQVIFEINRLGTVVIDTVMQEPLSFFPGIKSTLEDYVEEGKYGKASQEAERRLTDYKARLLEFIELAAKMQNEKYRLALSDKAADSPTVISPFRDKFAKPLHFYFENPVLVRQTGEGSNKILSQNNHRMEFNIPNPNMAVPTSLEALDFLRMYMDYGYNLPRYEFYQNEADAILYSQKLAEFYRDSVLSNLRHKLLNKFTHTVLNDDAILIRENSENAQTVLSTHLKNEVIPASYRIATSLYYPGRGVGIMGMLPQKKIVSDYIGVDHTYWISHRNAKAHKLYYSRNGGGHVITIKKRYNNNGARFPDFSGNVKTINPELLGAKLYLEDMKIADFNSPATDKSLVPAIESVVSLIHESEAHAVVKYTAYLMFLELQAEMRISQ